MKSQEFCCSKIQRQIPQGIPKVIWTFWNSNKLPNIVLYCISTWHKHNPDYNIVVITPNNIKEHITDDIITIKHAHETPARFSDYVRLSVLAQYGGIWMDATIICNHSLSWLHNIQQSKGVEFIGYHLDGYTTLTYSPVIESWFLACTKESWFIRAWKEEFFRTRRFSSIQSYLNSVTKMGVSMQNITDTLYLTIHVSAQVVLQSSLLNASNLIYTMPAEKSPYKYLYDYAWDSKKAVEALQNNAYYVNFPLIKLRSHESRLFKL